ncbi:autotransporter outer membrane beta-barrel domain-containing protein [Hyphomicrobium sp.]|uniref:autotransporter family protein n=1 Tax=Hyphomicrobium sp. TaxID=82 RepID=UPI001DE01106|nr:autotransporter outer membrane beta-barrel domain-containing protein [Hyphomicrobium sp.]MBY0561606.1 autotransporter outer membrane beta-barrel domain-containing protein [Hyphomicrobium sp.]
MSVSTHVLRRPAAQLILASLGAALSMGVSQQALAACTSGSAPNVIVCDGTSTNTTNISVGPGNLPATTGIEVVPLGEAARLTNFGNISINNNTFNAVNIIGINADDEGEYVINNSGNITLTSAGRGQLYGIAGNGDTEEMTVNNTGNISITRGPLTLTTVTATSLQASGGNLSAAAGVFSEEELEELSINNSGTISASGQLAAGIYSRAGEFELQNDGTVTHTAGRGAGIALGIVSDSGEIRSATIENNGTISGDIVAVGGNAVRWWALSNGLGTGGTQTDARLNINNQFGQLDSEITNRGTIDGNIYYGNGEHTLINEKGAMLTGNIDVDQRMQVVTGRSCTVGANGCFATATTTGTTYQGNPAAEAFNENSASTITAGAAVGSSTTYTLSMWGAKSFTFENAGTYVGNLTVETQAATTVGSFAVRDSQVTIAPHIFGGGGATANTASGAGTIGLIDGTLKIADGISNGAGGTSSIARTTTLAPVIDATVKSGEWYTVATTLFGTALPEVEGSALVSWEAAKNSRNALVIGADVKDAFDIEGISKPGAVAVNVLMDAAGADPVLDALGGAVQQLADDSDVAKAANQLAPETNFATQQAAIALNNAVGQHIDMRLNAVGATGGAPSFASGPSGLGMKQPSDPNRSNLGGGLKDDADFVAPRSAALWGQAFGAGLNQNTREQVDGYDARIYGALAGYDNWISPGVRVGVAGGYANTRITGDGDTSRNNTEIDSYLFQAYGAVKGSGWYASARTGFTWNDYDTTRVLTIPFTDKAEGNHDGGQFNAAIEVGAPMRFASTILAPVASLTYSRLHQSGYTESSDGGMALDVASQDNDSLVSGLGLKALVPIANDTVIQGRALWLHEFADDAQNVTASFAAGGGTFAAGGPAVGRDTAALGVGMLAQISAETTFELNYDANVREDYLAHIGSARVDVHF